MVHGLTGEFSLEKKLGNYAGDITSRRNDGVETVLRRCDDNKKACKRVRLRRRVSVLGRLVSSEKACERARLVGFVLEGV